MEVGAAAGDIQILKMETEAVQKFGFSTSMVIMQDIMGRNHLPSVYGIFNCIQGTGTLIVFVITGSLVDYFDTYKAPFRFFAASQVTNGRFCLDLTYRIVCTGPIKSTSVPN